MQVDEAGRAHPDAVVGVGALELDLVVVQKFGGLVLPSNINYDIGLRPYRRISRSHDLCIAEMLSEFTEESAGEYLIAVETSIMCANLFLHD